MKLQETGSFPRPPPRRRGKKVGSSVLTKYLYIPMRSLYTNVFFHTKIILDTTGVCMSLFHSLKDAAIDLLILTFMLVSGAFFDPGEM